MMTMRNIVSSVLLSLLLVSNVHAQDVGASVTCLKILRGGPDLDCIGNVVRKPSGEVNAQRWSVGCECLDRDMADFSKYGKYVSEPGASHARLQSGWKKTEQKKGRYDFKCLDDIADGRVRPVLSDQ